MVKSSTALRELGSFLDTKKGEPFHFMQECLKYCQIDVLILALATLCLEEATLQETDYRISLICSSSFTIAGLSSIYFTHLFMKERSIGLIPPNEYCNRTDLQSSIAQIFFRFLNKNRKAKGLELIQFSASSIEGELRVFRWKIDGWTSEGLWEFDSCFYHAHKCCFPVSIE